MKKILPKLFLIFFLLFPCHISFAESLEKIVQKLQKEVDATIDWQATFSQKAYIASVNQYDHSSGRVKIKKPGKIYWEYLEPERQVLVADGKKMYFYAEEDEQVIVSDLDAYALSGANLLFLAGEKKIKDLFHVTESREESTRKDIVRLKMVPKAEHPNLLYLVLTIERESARIIALRNVDPYENNTLVEFANIQKNSDVPDIFFNFQIPDGLEVIDASEMNP